MTVGQSTTKQTWLLQGVELRGIVRAGDGQPAGAVIGTYDDFNLEVDANYKHLAMQYDTDRVAKGEVHCETYPLPASQTNRDLPWPLPTKPDTETFMVEEPNGQRRELREGDHIRVVGRWTIDKHPENNVTRNRGWTRIGHVHLELHPFFWQGLALDPILPRTTNREVVSVAAPLFDEVYLSGDKWFGNWLAGVGSKVFIADDVSDFHNTVSATADILAPPLAEPGFTSQPDLIDWTEAVFLNGTGLDLSSVRSVTVLKDRVRVTASVTSPAIRQVNGMPIGDINDPARGASVFQAAYSVRWKPRLNMLSSLSVGHTAVNATTTFVLDVENVGPDPIEILDISNFVFEGGADPEFTISTVTPVVVPPKDGIELVGAFTPSFTGVHQTTLVLVTNDPGFGPSYEVLLTGWGT